MKYIEPLELLTRLELMILITEKLITDDTPIGIKKIIDSAKKYAEDTEKLLDR